MLDNLEFRAFLKTLGTRIRLLRKEKNILMRDIMITSGYYDAQWRKYESGGSLNVASLMKVALALDVSLIELLDGLGQWPKLSVHEIQQQSRLKSPQRSKIEPEVALKNEPESKPRRTAPSTSKLPLRHGAKPVGKTIKSATVTRLRTARSNEPREKRGSEK